jgi:hypothetical protein
MLDTAGFLAEVNEIFGFYFDMCMACQAGLGAVQKLQAQLRASDDSPYSVGDGPPIRSPDEELQRSLHDTTLGGVKARLKDGGFDLQKAAESALVFTFHIWDEKYRGKINGPDGKPKVDSDIMGDLRLIRNSIIHNKGVADSNVARCKIITRFKPGEKIVLTKFDIYAIVRAIRADFQKTS